MIVLAIDTSGATSSVAVLTDAGLAVAVADAPRSHARVLPELITRAARESGVPLSAITAVAVSRGPGLFTGMRVGLVTAEMFALARELPVAGVSTLQALAQRVIDQHQPVSAFAVLVDARRREVFAQTFSAAGEPLDEPRALGLQDLHGPSGIPEEGVAAGLFVDVAAAPFGFAGTPLTTDGLAAEVAGVAAARWRAAAGLEPATPLYLRRPDTTQANPARSVLGHP